MAMAGASREQARSLEEGLALLDQRLARSTLFADEGPHLQIVPTTSNPTAFGMYGLDLTLTLQMLPYTGVVDEAAKGVMWGMALFFGGIGQLVCGCLECSRRNTFACVTWLCFSAYWLGTGLVGILEAAEVLQPSAKGAAAFSALWGFLSFLLWTATFGTNLVLNLLLLMVVVLLWLESACTSHPQLSRATGIFGIVVAALAFYDGTASLYADMYGREVLPVGHFKWSWMRRGTRRLGSEASTQGAACTGALPAHHCSCLLPRSGRCRGQGLRPSCLARWASKPSLAAAGHWHSNRHSHVTVTVGPEAPLFAAPLHPSPPRPHARAINLMHSWQAKTGCFVLPRLIPVSLPPVAQEPTDMVPLKCYKAASSALHHWLPLPQLVPPPGASALAPAGLCTSAWQQFFELLSVRTERYGVAHHLQH
ncbi:hypothetical protein ABPG75_012478 [Micractinium tetrahymenae]